MKVNRPILLVEDDQVDIMTIQRTIKDLKINKPLHIANDGEQALSYLENCGNVKPGLIVLDINMPRMNGIEFLKEWKKKGNEEIPVVVFTTSANEADKQAVFEYQVADYMVKPVSYKKFVEVVKNIEKYWVHS